MKIFEVSLRRIVIAAITIFSASHSSAAAIMSVQDVAGLGVPGVVAVSGGNTFGLWQFRTLSSDPIVTQAVMGGTWNWRLDWDLLVSDGSATTPVSMSFFLTSPFSALATAPVPALGSVNSGSAFSANAMLGLEPGNGDGIFIFTGNIPTSEQRLLLVLGNNGSITATPVPVPFSGLLLASGLALFAGFRRRPGIKAA